MFQLTNESLTVYPHMVLMHPDDYAQLGRDKFDPFRSVYIDRLTGDRIWPTNPHESHPNWETLRRVGDSGAIWTMNQLRQAGRLVHTWREYPRKLNEETLFKELHCGADGEIVLASTFELPDIKGPLIGNFYCNNQTSTGSVYRTADDSQILLFSTTPDAEEEGLGESFSVLPEGWRLSESEAIIPPGEYVFAPGSAAPYHNEPITPLTLISAYRANVVIGSGGWLMGVMLTKDK